MRLLVRAHAPYWQQLSLEKKMHLSYFHRCEKVVESKIQYTALSFIRNFGVFPRRASQLPLKPRALLRNLGPLPCCYQTARDCRRLKRRGQAKSARRSCRVFTSRAQFFHKLKNPVRNSRYADSKGNFVENSQSERRSAQKCTDGT